MPDGLKLECMEGSASTDSSQPLLGHHHRGLGADGQPWCCHRHCSHSHVLVAVHRQQVQARTVGRADCDAVAVCRLHAAGNAVLASSQQGGSPGMQPDLPDCPVELGLVLNMFLHCAVTATEAATPCLATSIASRQYVVLPIHGRAADTELCLRAVNILCHGLMTDPFMLYAFCLCATCCLAVQINPVQRCWPPRK